MPVEHDPDCCLHPESACTKAGGCSSSCNCELGGEAGAFWSDLRRDLHGPQFREAYEVESRRIAALDEEANRLGHRPGRAEQLWRSVRELVARGR